MQNLIVKGIWFVTNGGGIEVLEEVGNNALSDGSKVLLAFDGIGWYWYFRPQRRQRQGNSYPCANWNRINILDCGWHFNGNRK